MLELLMKYDIIMHEFETCYIKIINVENWLNSFWLQNCSHGIPIYFLMAFVVMCTYKSRMTEAWQIKMYKLVNTSNVIFVICWGFSWVHIIVLSGMVGMSSEQLISGNMNL